MAILPGCMVPVARTLDGFEKRYDDKIRAPRGNIFLQNLESHFIFNLGVGSALMRCGLQWAKITGRDQEHYRKTTQLASKITWTVSSRGISPTSIGVRAAAAVASILNSGAGPRGV